MTKKNDEQVFENNWYDIWMKQSKDFYETAEKNFKDLFSKNTQVNPDEHIKLIHHWLDALKNQWANTHLNEQQKAYETYWKMMNKMCFDASDMLVQQWVKRVKENNPIKNTHDLYELWLNCCNDIYKKAINSHSYQDAYGDMLNAAIHFWKSALNK